MRRNTGVILSRGAWASAISRGGVEVASNSNMQAAARLDQVNMQNASKQKKMLAEGRWKMKTPHWGERVVNMNRDSLRSVVERQAWLVGGSVGGWEIGQCKQSSWQPLCRWEKNMLGIQVSSDQQGPYLACKAIFGTIAFERLFKFENLTKQPNCSESGKIEAWWAGLPCSNGHCCCCKLLEKCTSANRWPTFEPPSNFWATKPLPPCNWRFQPSYLLPLNNPLKLHILPPQPNKSSNFSLILDHMHWCWTMLTVSSDDHPLPAH